MILTYSQVTYYNKRNNMDNETLKHTPVNYKHICVQFNGLSYSCTTDSGTEVGYKIQEQLGTAITDIPETIVHVLEASPFPFKFVREYCIQRGIRYLSWWLQQGETEEDIYIRMRTTLPDNATFCQLSNSVPDAIICS